MMIRPIVVALFAGWAGLAMAADEGQGLQGNKVAASAEQEPASSGPAMGGQAASAVPAAPAMPAAPGATAEPSGTMAPAPAPATAEAPKSSIPLEKRKGGDITECLAAGSGSDKDIAACAEKYRPKRGGGT